MSRAYRPCGWTLPPASDPTAKGTPKALPTTRYRVASRVLASDAVVYVDAIPGKAFPAPATHAVVDQVRLAFVPHVLPVLVGTTVDFNNSDNVNHNVFTPAKCAGAFNLGSWGRGSAKSHTFDKPCVADLLCNVHSEMEGYVLAVPTPRASARPTSWSMPNARAAPAPMAW